MGSGEVQAAENHKGQLKPRQRKSISDSAPLHCPTVLPRAPSLLPPAPLMLPSAPLYSLDALLYSLDALPRSLGAPSKTALLPFPSRNGSPQS